MPQPQNACSLRRVAGLLLQAFRHAQYATEPYLAESVRLSAGREENGKEVHLHS